MPALPLLGLLLLALSVVQMGRAVFRLKVNTPSGGNGDVMGRDITFSYDYLVFVLAALSGIWCFTHEWPKLLATVLGLVAAKFILGWLLVSLFDSE